jgi:hypothetical protein
VPLPPPNQHPAVAAPVEKGGYCKVCENKLKKRYKNMTVQELRKMKDKHGNKLVG